MHGRGVDRESRRKLVLIDRKQAGHVKTVGAILRRIRKFLESLTREHVGLRVRPLILDDLTVLGLANDLAGQLRGVGEALAQRSPMRRIWLHDCTNAQLLALVDQLLHEFFIGRVIRPDLVVLVPGVLSGGVDPLVLNPQNLVVIVRGRGGVACRGGRSRGG